MAVSLLESVAVNCGLYKPSLPAAGVPPKSPEGLTDKPAGSPVTDQVKAPSVPPKAWSGTGLYNCPTVPAGNGEVGVKMVMGDAENARTLINAPVRQMLQIRRQVTARIMRDFQVSTAMVLFPRTKPLNASSNMRSSSPLSKSPGLRISRHIVDHARISRNRLARVESHRGDDWT